MTLDNDKTELLNRGGETELLQDDDRTVLLPSSQNNPLTESSGAISEQIGCIFANTYKIIGKIGEGSGGLVYKALHTRLNKEVVIKQIISPNAALNRNETDLLKGLKHSFLPQVLDFIEQDGIAYTVMDFISGSDIEKLVKSGKSFSGKETVRIGIQLCEAAAYLHRQKPPIVHSDIKPSNVMLSENGNICLIDFNISLIFDKNAKTIGGTPGYAPPEQFGIPLEDIRGNAGGALPVGKTAPHIDERSDVYGIGAFMYFLIAKEAPAANYRCKPLTSFNKNIPDGLLHIIGKAMMLSPQKRYKNAEEMLGALKNIGRLDKRYKALKARRLIATILAVIFTAASVGINRAGRSKLAEEHEERYLSYIQEIEEKIAVEDFDGAEEIIGLAAEFEPARIEPYYCKSKLLYQSKSYDECARYPEKVITSEILGSVNSREQAAEIYEMAADSAFRLEDYGQSAKMYETALKYSDKAADCYRDLAISYARSGNIEKAESTLEAARSKGMTDDKLELMQGEISFAKGNTDGAFECFERALEMTEDDYIRFRALLVCDKMMMAAEGDIKQNALKMTELLKAWQDKISAENSDIVLEMLANEYVRAEEYQKAAEVYEKLLKSGSLGYSLQKNYFNLLFSKLGQYEKCLALLKDMAAANPEDYWVDMNLSYVMISAENAKENQSERDYSQAYDSYKTAEEKYKAFTLNGKTDANMDSLRQAVKELKSYGWIKEE